MAEHLSNIANPNFCILGPPPTLLSRIGELPILIPRDNIFSANLAVSIHAPTLFNQTSYPIKEIIFNKLRFLEKDMGNLNTVN